VLLMVYPGLILVLFGRGSARCSANASTTAAGISFSGSSSIGGFGGCVYAAAARRHNGRIRRLAMFIDRSI
jgi:hypothetical protein